MSQNTKIEVLEKLRWRYASAGLEHKTKLIDEAVQLLGYHRKSAIRALRRKRRPVSKRKLTIVIGRPRTYAPELLLPVLKVIWLAGQQPCGRRLASMLPEWVPAYEAYHRPIAAEVREQLLEVSSATLDRLLIPVRVQSGRFRATRPGTMLRQEIPIRGGSWQAGEAGWMEADTVSLGGGNASGEVAWVLDSTDICTTWVGRCGRCMAGGRKARWSSLKTWNCICPFRGWDWTAARCRRIQSRFVSRLSSHFH